jgi:hypothetical protein
MVRPTRYGLAGAVPKNDGARAEAIYRQVHPSAAMHLALLAMWGMRFLSGHVAHATCAAVHATANSKSMHHSHARARMAECAARLWSTARGLCMDQLYPTDLLQHRVGRCAKLSPPPTAIGNRQKMVKRDTRLCPRHLVSPADVLPGPAPQRAGGIGGLSTF